jgi:dynein heavy chain
LDATLATFSTIHQSVEVCAKKYSQEMGRVTYVTPTSYLELLSCFKKILQLKRKEVGTLIHRFQSGLDKLASAEEQVATMEKELTDMQPILEQTSKDVAELMVVIQRDKKVAEETKEVVDKQAAAAEEQAAEAKIIKDDAQKDLDEALPALDAAVKSLQSLKLSHLQEIKALADPPAGVKLAMEAICIMFQVKPKMVAGEQPGKKVADYWEPSKNIVLSDPKKFLNDLFEFDKDNIPQKVIDNIQPYMDNENFTPELIKKSSVACEALCMWTKAMHKYHFVALGVEPKRKALAAAEAILNKTMAELKAAKDELQGIQDKLAKLEADYEGSIAKQKQLKDDSDMCVVKLERADKLIGGLGG